MKKIMVVGICIFTLCSFMACSNIQVSDSYEEEVSKQDSAFFYILGDTESVGKEQIPSHNACCDNPAFSLAARIVLPIA